MFEEAQAPNKKVSPSKYAEGTGKQSAIAKLTGAITDIAKDAIIETFQQNSPIRSLAGFKTNLAKSTNHIATANCTSTCNTSYVDVEAAIDQSLAISAHASAKSPSIATDIGLKNDLRKEMGGIPTTVLHGTNRGTVAQYQKKVSSNSKAKCSRSYRNNLDLSVFSDSSDDKELFEQKSKVDKKTLDKSLLKKRVQVKLLQMHKA